MVEKAEICSIMQFVQQGSKHISPFLIINYVKTRR